jgi:GT2 family glycosyltransferase
VIALEDVREIVVVIDGAEDDTEEVLADFGDERVRVIKHSHRQGSQAARKTGRLAADGKWIVMLDDDCAVPPDFARILRETAVEHGADIVAAPWVHPDPGIDPDHALAEARAHPVRWVGLNTSPSLFPDHDLETPFLPGNVLINRRVFERVGYDEGLTRNAWREETALYLDACAAGFRCILTPRTASFQLGQWDGGQRLPRLSYEWYALRNNWRFLWRYRGDLRARGEIRGPVSAEAKFFAERASAVVKGYLGARLRRLRA